MQYNKLSGSTIDVNTSIIFKEFEDEHFFMGFARLSESWGNYALINISLNSITIDSLISTAGAEDNFTDKNISSSVDADYRVYIYKTTSAISDFDATLSNYSKIPELELYDLKLHYINSSWAVLKGLPPTYTSFINTNSNEKFYIIRNNTSIYSTTPDNITAIAKIQLKSEFDNSINNEPVILKVVNGTEIPAIYNLNLVTNILGELVIDGLSVDNFNSPSISEEILLNDYAIDSTDVIQPTTPYFITRKSVNQSLIVFDKMYLMRTQTDDGIDTIWHQSLNDSYLLFRVSNVFEQNFYVKISRSSASTELGIYHESLQYEVNTINSINNISDANPAGIDSTYLKNQEFHDSIFDIGGLVKIKKNQVTDITPTDLYSKISFVKEMKSESEKNTYIDSYGFSYSELSSKRLEEVVITSTETVTHYGNIRKNPKTSDGNYPLAVSRLYLYSNNFVIGDQITIKYWDDLSTVQDKNTNDEFLIITGISYQEDNYYIEFNGVTNTQIIFDENSPSDEAVSSEDANIVSIPTTVIVRVDYAVCDSLLDAKKYNMNKVMIDMHIPKTDTDLYSGIYRQLIITHQPKYNNNGVMTTCSMDLYSGNLFDSVAHKYDIGTVIYIANKSPIYRKYLTDKEIFKLII